ncbi:MAG: glutamate-5-semialdehyde dehydrogenase, partial [Proteobacteria bacterium]
MNSTPLPLESIRQAAATLRLSSVETRNQVHLELAARLERDQAHLLTENQKDLLLLQDDATDAFRDRLRLNENRIRDMAESLRQVAKLPDPIGEAVESRTLENGLKLRKVRSPLGVIFLIFESRPNVAIESFSLALKSGNAIILRGGKESMNTTRCFYDMMRDALENAKLPRETILGITDPDRELVRGLLYAKNFIDVVIPRGGEKLIEFVVENSRIPIIKNDRGLCHVYVHDDANLQMALEIISNSKTHRPGVCNAAETLLIHERVADEFFKKVYFELAQVDFYLTGKDFERFQTLGTRIHAAESDTFSIEHLDLKLNVKVVASVAEAIAHIEIFSSRHSESIVTTTESVARAFQSAIDSACVYWNASTRFTDGFQMGLGGEIG